jgi:putative ABC transport system permease protein
MISETLARRLPGDNVIGQRLIVGPANREPFTIIGVVGDVRQASLADPSADAVYMPAEHWAFADRVRWLVLRTHGDPLALAAAARAAVAAVDRNQPIVRVATMEQLLAQSAVDRRFAMILFQLFGLAGLLLVATGLYGVLANAVSERTREIGVRVALGASRGGIVRLVGAQSLTLLGLGMAVGLPAAAAASGALTALLFGLSPLDPTTYAGVAGLVALIATVSCALPAWRATRVDPAITLRAE